MIWVAIEHTYLFTQDNASSREFPVRTNWRCKKVESSKTLRRAIFDVGIHKPIERQEECFMIQTKCGFENKRKLLLTRDKKEKKLTFNSATPISFQCILQISFPTCFFMWEPRKGIWVSFVRYRPDTWNCIHISNSLVNACLKWYSNCYKELLKNSVRHHL